MDNVSRNVVFGVQDGVVTTIGLISGLLLNTRKFTNDHLRFVVLSILVSSVSMSIGSYQSERAAENFSPEGPQRMRMLYGALVMFISYFIAGMLVLIPYYLGPKRNDPPRKLLIFSVLISVTILFITGYVTASLSEYAHVYANAFETALLGLIAVAVGYVSGLITIK